MVDSKFIITPALRQALATAELAYREDISDNYSAQEAGWTHLSPSPYAFQDLINAGLLERELVGQSQTPMYRITPTGIETLTALRKTEQGKRNDPI